MTDPKDVRAALKTLADHYAPHSLLVSGVARNALAEIKALEAKLAIAVEALEDLHRHPYTNQAGIELITRATLTKIKETRE